MRQKAVLQYLLFLLASAAFALPLVTAPFAAIPMRASRRAFGRGAFWSGHLAVAFALAFAGQIPAAIAMVLLAALVGSYAEVDDKGASVFVSGSFAVGATLGAALIGAGALIAKTKGGIVAQAREEVAAVAREMTEYNPKLGDVNVDAIVYQTPSFLAVMLILGLAAALIWENRALRFLQLPGEEGLRERLLSYRVPDVFVWVTMAAILGAFALQGRWPSIENASMNVFNVLAALYFFQGLAVVARAFDAFQVTTFWRGFWYVMIAIQLHLLVSALGFADYWADFRSKLPKKPRPVESN